MYALCVMNAMFFLLFASLLLQNFVKKSHSTYESFIKLGDDRHRGSTDAISTMRDEDDNELDADVETIDSAENGDSSPKEQTTDSDEKMQESKEGEDPDASQNNDEDAAATETAEMAANEDGEMASNQKSDEVDAAKDDEMEQPNTNVSSFAFTKTPKHFFSFTFRELSITQNQKQKKSIPIRTIFSLEN